MRKSRISLRRLDLVMKIVLNFGLLLQLIERMLRGN
jgi:hypothetical protein